MDGIVGHWQCCATRPGKGMVLGDIKALRRNSETIPPLLMPPNVEEGSTLALAEGGHETKLKALLDSMSSSKARKAVDEADPETGTTPLIAAAKAGHCGCIELLIAKGASVNKTNKNGWTPLMAAARRNAVRILIMSKADASVELCDDVKALDFGLQARDEAKTMVDKLKMLSPRSLAKRGSLNADNAGHKDAAYLLKEAEDNAFDKQEEEATLSVTEAASKQVAAAGERIKRLMRGSLVADAPAPPKAGEAEPKPGDAMMSPRGVPVAARKTGDAMVSPRGRAEPASAGPLLSPRGN